MLPNKEGRVEEVVWTAFSGYSGSSFDIDLSFAFFPILSLTPAKV